MAWDYEFSVSGSTAFTCTPDEEKTFEYAVSPVDSVISVESTDSIENGGSAFSYEVVSNGDGKGKIIIHPASETSKAVDIVFVAKNPNKSYETVGAKTIKAQFAYSSVSVDISQSSANGKYSRFDSQSNTLFLGDGESSNIVISIAEEKSNATIQSVTAYGNGAPSISIVSSAEKSGVYAIRNSQADVVKKEYLINKAYVPYIGNAELSDWETAFAWYADVCKHSSAHDCFTFAQIYSSNNRSFNYSGNRRSKNASRDSLSQWMQQNWAYRAIGRDQGVWSFGHFNGSSPSYTKSSSFSIREKASLRGKIYQESDFQKIAGSIALAHGQARERESCIIQTEAISALLTMQAEFRLLMMTRAGQCGSLLLY